MTCETCQKSRGWWHKSQQQCSKCGGWPLPPDEAMGRHEKGGSYYDERRDLERADLALRVARESLGRRADQDDARNTAERYRSGAADDNPELRQHVDTALLAIEMYDKEKGR